MKILPVVPGRRFPRSRRFPASAMENNMGCDIHFYVEKKTDQGWEMVSPPDSCKFHWSEKYDYKYVQWKEIEENGKIFYIKENDIKWDLGRNYDLFAQLANVRNGSGFAGCDTGDGFSPIDMPRGMPDDISEEINQERYEWGVDGHSDSHLLLKELLEYPASDLNTQLRGIIPLSQYKEWRKKDSTFPKYWCGGTNAEVMTVQEADEFLDNNPDYKSKNSMLESKNVLVSWPASYKDCTKHFWGKIVPEMQKLGDPDRIRAVFWFDS